MKYSLSTYIPISEHPNKIPGTTTMTCNDDDDDDDDDDDVVVVVYGVLIMYL